MIGPLRESNIPGGCYLQLVPADRVSQFPTVVNGAIASPILLFQGDWLTITPTRFTQQFREDWERRGGARVAVASVAAIIPKDRVQLLASLWDLGRQRFVVLHHDLNGTVKVIGSKDEPATVRVVKLDHGTRVGSDRNQYELQVTVARRDTCPFYLAAPPSTPGTGGECLPVGIYSPTGTLLQMVPSGGSYQLEDTTTTCPTLAQLVAALENMYQLLAVMSEEQVEQMREILFSNIDEVDGGGPDTDHNEEVDPGGDDEEEPETTDFEDTDFEPEEFA